MSPRWSDWVPSEDELKHYDRLAGSTGLVKVWDGTEWLDMRDMTCALIRVIRRERSESAATFELNGELTLLLVERDALIAELTQENERLQKEMFSWEQAERLA